MLDLQARVHLQEVEAPLPVHDELHRTGRFVVHRPRQRHRLPAHGPAGLRVDERRRRLLDDLLVPALDRALALAQVEGVPVPVRKHLDLDVARLLDEPLDEEAVVAEARPRLAPRALEPLAAFGVVARDPHPLAPASGARLEHHRIADLAGDANRLVRIGHHPRVARNGADPGLLRDALGGDLVAHRLDGARRRADERDAGIRQRLAERAVLGEEPVAGMHGLRAARAAGGDDRLDPEIALRRRRPPDAHRLVRLLDVQRAAIRLRVHRHGADPHPPRGTDHPAGDLDPVGDEDLVEEHACTEHSCSSPVYGTGRTPAPSPCQAASRFASRARTISCMAGVSFEDSSDDNNLRQTSASGQS